jgi:hypothetical protein
LFRCSQAVTDPFGRRCLTSRTLPRFHLPLIEPDLQICRIRLSDGLRRPAHASVRTEASPARLAPSVTAEPLVGLLGRSANPRALGPFHSASEVRPLPSTGVTRLPRYYGPVRRLRQPGLSLAGVRLGHAPTGGGLPCCVESPCADMLSPLPRWDRCFGMSRSPRSNDGGLPRDIGGSAPSLKFSRPARRSRALRPACSRDRLNDPFRQRLQPCRHRHNCSDCYRLERPLAGWELHPLKIDAFARRTMSPVPFGPGRWG